MRVSLCFAINVRMIVTPNITHFRALHSRETAAAIVIPDQFPGTGRIATTAYPVAAPRLCSIWTGKVGGNLGAAAAGWPSSTVNRAIFPMSAEFRVVR